MLRHIISVSLAMTACASLMSTKANAATLTFLPVGTLQRNPGDSIEFILTLNPSKSANSGEVETVRIRGIFISYDFNELFLLTEWKVPFNTIVNKTTTIASFTFNVLKPVKNQDGNVDVSTVVGYTVQDRAIYDFSSNNFKNDIEPVPEPLTIFGTATALGCGAILKRKSFKTKKN
jgi:hypothetical protein